MPFPVSFFEHNLMALNLLQASQEHLISSVLPLLVRAYDDTDARIQEEVLRRTVPLARQLDVQVINMTSFKHECSTSFGGHLNNYMIFKDIVLFDQ